jgi:hypothetical protein
MAPRVEIQKTEQADGDFVEFGPLLQGGRNRARIPKTFSRKAVYPDLGLEAHLECSFSGDRIELHRLELHRNDGSITTRDLTQLALPWVIREVANNVIPDSFRLSVFIRDNHDLETVKQQKGPTDEILRNVAQIYWYEHVTWGTPRGEIMEFWGISRTTANAWIKKAAKLYGLPGAHAGDSDGGGE